MNPIPPDIYARVHELALRLTNASEAGDTVLEESGYESLRAYHAELTPAGQGCPFLTETLADFAANAAAAVEYYELALAPARTMAGEPTHPKLISPAGRLLELGRREQAKACLRDGRAEAVRLADADWIKEADRLGQTAV